MASSLFVTFRYGSIIRQLTFRDWLEGENNQFIAIAINPEVDPEDQQLYLWRGNKFYFTLPGGVLVQRRWRSKSDGSRILYPAYWQCGKNTDIACIIVPPGAESSRHLHKQTVERFGTMFNDGDTNLWLNGSSPITLENDVDVEIGDPHFLKREATQYFSAHLIRMTGPVRFPDRSDHYTVPEPAATYA